MPAAPNLAPLVAYLHGLRAEELPPPVVGRAVEIILDTVGCALGGTRTDLGATQARVLGRLAGSGPATGLGVRRGLDPVSAAFLNATLADALDYEDTLLGHPSATIVPAALAVGEVVGASGRDVIAAVVAGYEVGVRIARATRPSAERAREIAAGYAWKAFGAVAAAAKLLGLTAEQTMDAFGYAGAASPVPVWITKWRRPLHWLKNNFGEQARAGVLGAFMAREGFRGPRLILDSDLGFWRMIGSDRFDPAELTRGLGTHYEIAETHIKPYPACRFLHTLIEVVRALRERERLRPEDVEAVTVRSFREMTDWFDDPEPETLVDAEFSAPYAVGVALLDLPVGPEWYLPQTMRDRRLLALARTVRLEGSAEADAGFARGLYPVEVTIRTRDGRRLVGAESVPLGSPARPVAAAEVERKFATLAGPVLGAGPAREVWAIGQRLPSLGDIREWTVRLVGEP
ncbi:MAG TPA: MmgE/PrpD family protein [Thermodesulfobacteriota bacterium]